MKPTIIAAVVGIAIGSAILYALVKPREIFEISYAGSDGGVWKSMYAETMEEAKVMAAVLKQRGFVKIQIHGARVANAAALIKKSRSRIA